MGKCFLEKYDGLGNDYLVLDPNLNSIELTEEKIKKICNRNFGVGSDGILYGPILKDNNIKVIIDGEEVDFTRKEVALIRLAIKF